ncbi:methyl-accepting chemotaxis sensory transducer [Shewanella psychrophila]|uniref:Methyl-accepting chemotaxis sensory transducer n=1 Tax=Shewanella psychrophila TaxID=225848 RepID=A0A1S6HLV9_9GAMM|nr:methyl-accepting chemotaxis protein [Shewanella psychrophila]AQS36500.1 methyl-accepting chemotaxis sensory transducer [Shewanella psychrophila]
MKEVKFRWVDQFLIQMTLKTKFAILAIIPILTLIGLSFILYSQFMQQITQSHNDTAQQQSRAIDEIVTLSASYIPQAQQADYFSQLTRLQRVIKEQNLSREQAQAANRGGGIVKDNYQTQAIGPQNNTGVVASVTMRDLSTVMDSSRVYVITCLMALILIIIISNYTISSFVGGALYTNVMALKRAADGDLTSRLNFFEVKDEFSILAISIDTLVERQHNLVTQLSQASQQIREVVQSFRQNAQEGQSLASNQRQHLDSLATAMEEMTAAVKEVARNAEQSSIETQEANAQVDAGSNDIATTVDAIEMLSNEIGEASTAVDTLNDNAAKIDAVVTTINSISEQTNLLALNAAIEAARAGEQGRGFAVVADEVRTLAGRTQDATVEIKSMIEALQSGAQDLTQVMKRTVDKANEGKKHVLDTGDDLKAIAEHSGRVYEMSVLIATSADEQSAVANEIATNLMEIRNQSHNVEQSANDSVSGCDGLHATAEQLDQLLVGLKI